MIFNLYFIFSKIRLINENHLIINKFEIRLKKLLRQIFTNLGNLPLYEQI